MKLPPRHPFLYILTLVIIPIAFISIVEYTHASPFQTFPYQVAPALYKNCEHHFIGSLYYTSIEPYCAPVWAMMTREQLLDAPYIH